MGGCAYIMCKYYATLHKGISTPKRRHSSPSIPAKPRMSWAEDPEPQALVRIRILESRLSTQNSTHLPPPSTANAFVLC